MSTVANPDWLELSEYRTTHRAPGMSSRAAALIGRFGSVIGSRCLEGKHRYGHPSVVLLISDGYGNETEQFHNFAYGSWQLNPDAGA